MDFTLETAISLGSAVVAGGTFIYSAYRNFSQDRINAELRRQQALLESKYNKLADYEIRHFKEQELAKTKADLRADFVLGNQNMMKLVISNVGQATARNVQIHFPNQRYFVLLQDVNALFPRNIEASSKVELLATSELGIQATCEHFILEWTDDSGEQDKAFNVQYL